ncbi:MAG: hypothetical protein JWO56_1624 [Acidobacteria bacterium]|nr:hypothetical protein [Acidobacteriota bacterium]
MPPSAKVLIVLSVLIALAVIALIVAPTPAIGQISRAARAANDDVVAFGRHVTIDHPVSGNVIVLNGAVTIEQPVSGDVVVFGGDVTIHNEGHVNGDVVCLGGTVNGTAQQISGDVFVRSTESALVSGAPRGVLAMLMIAVKLTLLLLWLVVTVLVTLAAGRELRQAAIEVRSAPLHTFAVGLVGYTSFILTAILFSTLIPFMVGVPLLIVLAVFAIFAKVFGTIAVFHAVGTLVAGARTREQLASRRFLRGDLAMTVIGLLILGAIRMVPIVGTILWGVASLFGVGAALATAFGRREPWFLADHALARLIRGA